jgi:hypothetical protein
LIPKEWTESIDANFVKFFGVVSKLDSGGFLNIFEDSMEEKVVMLAEALVALANYFNGANVKFDVSKMPSYIQDDYLKAKSRPLIEEDIDNLIKVVDGQFRKNTITEQNDYFSEKLQKLKNLKREFRIKNLLS